MYVRVCVIGCESKLAVQVLLSLTWNDISKSVLAHVLISRPLHPAVGVQVDVLHLLQPIKLLTEP